MQVEYDMVMQQGALILVLLYKLVTFLLYIVNTHFGF